MRPTGSSALPGRSAGNLARVLRIAHGRLFRRVTGQGKTVAANRLNDQEVARLVKRTALTAGVRGALPEGERGKMFAGHAEQVTNALRNGRCPLAVTVVVMSEPR